MKAKLRQHEQRMSNEVRMQFVPFGAQTTNAGKGENGKMKAKLRQHEQRTSNAVRTQFVPFGARTANAGKEQRK